MPDERSASASRPANIASFASGSQEIEQRVMQVARRQSVWHYSTYGQHAHNETDPLPRPPKTPQRYIRMNISLIAALSQVKHREEFLQEDSASMGYENTEPLGRPHAAGYRTFFSPGFSAQDFQPRICSPRLAAQFRSEVGWVVSKAIWLVCPRLTDRFVGREAA